MAEDAKKTREQIQQAVRQRMREIGGPGSRPYEYQYVPKHQRRETVDPAHENPFDRRRQED